MQNRDSSEFGVSSFIHNRLRTRDCCPVDSKTQQNTHNKEFLVQNVHSAEAGTLSLEELWLLILASPKGVNMGMSLCFSWPQGHSYNVGLHSCMNFVILASLKKVNNNVLAWKKGRILLFMKSEQGLKYISYI